MTLAGMLLGAVEQRALRARRCPSIGLVDRVADEQLEVGRDLVVARARGVQPARRLADQLGQAVLDMHVDVFERRILGQLARPRYSAATCGEALVDRAASSAGR